MKQASFFQKLTAVYLVCMAGVLLLYTGSTGYVQITVQKSQAYLILSGVYALICVIGRLELALLGGRPLPKLPTVWKKLHLTQKLVMGLWLATAISAIMAVDRTTAFRGGSHWEGFWTLSLYYVCFLLVSELVRPKTWMLGVFAAAMSVNCLVAQLQLAGYNPLELYPLGTNYFDGNRLYLGKFLGTIGSVTLQAAMLSLSIPAFSVALLKGKGKSRFFLLIPLALCVQLLFRIGISAGYVGAFGGLLLSLPVLPSTTKNRKRLLLAVILLLVVAAVAVYFCGAVLPDFLPELSRVLHGEWDDSFGSNRGYIWRWMLELVPERLLFGGGPDTIGLRLDKVINRHRPLFNASYTQVLDMAHNEYLNMLVNQGLLALVLYLTFLASAARQWLRLANQDTAAAVCGAAALGYCLQAFFGLSTPFTTSYLWITLAVLVSCCKRKNAEGGNVG